MKKGLFWQALKYGFVFFAACSCSKTEPPMPVQIPADSEMEDAYIPRPVRPYNHEAPQPENNKWVEAMYVDWYDEFIGLVRENAEFQADLKITGLEFKDYSGEAVLKPPREKFVFTIPKNMRFDDPDMFLYTGGRIERLFDALLLYGRKNVQSMTELLCFLEYDGSIIQFLEKGKEMRIAGKMSLGEWDSLLDGLAGEYSRGNIRIHKAISIFNGAETFLYLSCEVVPEEAYKRLFIKIDSKGGINKKYLTDIGFQQAIYDLGYFYSKTTYLEYDDNWLPLRFKEEISFFDTDLKEVFFSYESVVNKNYDGMHFILPFEFDGKMGFTILNLYWNVSETVAKKGEANIMDLTVFKTYIADFENLRMELLDEGVYTISRGEDFLTKFVRNNMDKRYANLAFVPEGFLDKINEKEYYSEEYDGKNVVPIVILGRTNLYNEELVRQLIEIDYQKQKSGD